MKSITLHNIDDQLEQRISEISREQHSSLNKTIQGILRKSLGLDKNHDRKELFMDLFGVWSEEDQKEFRENTRDFDRIDPEDWK